MWFGETAEHQLGGENSCSWISPFGAPPWEGEISAQYAQVHITGNLRESGERRVLRRTLVMGQVGVGQSLLWANCPRRELEFGSLKRRSTSGGMWVPAGLTSVHFSPSVVCLFRGVRPRPECPPPRVPGRSFLHSLDTSTTPPRTTWTTQFSSTNPRHIAFIFSVLPSLLPVLGTPFARILVDSCAARLFISLRSANSPRNALLSSRRRSSLEPQRLAAFYTRIRHVGYHCFVCLIRGSVVYISRIVTFPRALSLRPWANQPDATRCTTKQPNMVSFVCDTCQTVVTKPKLKKHLQRYVLSSCTFLHHLVHRYFPVTVVVRVFARSGVRIGGGELIYCVLGHNNRITALTVIRLIHMPPSSFGLLLLPLV